jgi:hypothetical protein
MFLRLASASYTFPTPKSAIYVFDIVYFIFPSSNENVGWLNISMNNQTLIENFVSIE